MKLSSILTNLRKSTGLTQMNVAGFFVSRGKHITNKAVSKWESGDTQPNAEQFLLLCELYGVGNVLKTFVDKSGGSAELNDLGYAKLIEYKKLLLLDKRFVENGSGEGQSATRTIPLYDIPVSAGTGQFLDSDDYELIEADETVPKAASFALRVRGDSMEPKFHDGDTVFVKQQQALDEGEIGIFMLNGEAYLKKFESGALVSLNAKYDPIVLFEHDDFRVFGKVLA